MSRRFHPRWQHGLVALLLLPWLVRAENRSAAPVQFNRDIRPILSENCFYCHGADGNNRKAKLRLDVREDAISHGAFVPGKVEESELIKRIFTTDLDDQMPPVNSNRHLSPAQKELLRTWIAQGAKYDAHWAFQTPVRPAVPKVKQAKWVQNPIDAFVLQRLETEKLKPTPPASTERLLRRVSLDLVGLPPTPEQMQRWQKSRKPLDAAVDELLASPHFGERMATDWMDVARYADTHGFNNDSSRSMWPWRDWVIDAFNQNLPYDQFITAQLAGDLLPHPTPGQQIATGFNRNHVINSEGGIIDEEYRVEYVADRVRTTSLAWMGLTMECARCHDHKFDPIKQADYFKFFAFFNSVDEHGEDGRIANASPFLPAPTKEQQAQMDQHRTTREAALKRMDKMVAAQDWAKVDWTKLTTVPCTSAVPATNLTAKLDLSAWDGKAPLTNLAGGKLFVVKGTVGLTNGPAGLSALVFDGQSQLKSDALPKGDKQWGFSAWVRRDGSADMPIFSTMNFGVPASSQGYGRGVEIRFTPKGAVEVRAARRWPAYSAAIVTHETVPVGEWHHLVVTCNGQEKARALRVLLDGEECYREGLHDDFADVGLSGDIFLGASGEKESAKFTGALADMELWIKQPEVDALASTARNETLAGMLALHPHGNSPVLHRAWLAQTQPEFAKAQTEERQARTAWLALERDAPTTMVMAEMATPRATHILFRGQYDLPRELVQPGVPDFLPPFPAAAPRNRLGLAQWFTDAKNPLTSRVVVNRFWQEFFGTGLVKNSENFGFQSEWPSHPELLDWLAVEFRESGWDVKKFVRLIVSSATYQQDARSTPALNERDPENRFLAHGPRQRLTAEMLRDQALVLGGLLRDKIGGPPVYPYQPTNLYKGIVVAADYPGTSYVDGQGDDLYRRSLYTFWKRTVPHPTLATFDAPDREVCVARRLKTNTPLQALALMNDLIQLEAARKLAERMLTEGGVNMPARLRFAFKLATARTPDAAEQKALGKLLADRLAHYQAHPDAAKALLTAGASPVDAKLNPVELAAYANVASLILNLDETITRN